MRLRKGDVVRCATGRGGGSGHAVGRSAQDVRAGS